MHESSSSCNDSLLVMLEAIAKCCISSPHGKLRFLAPLYYVPCGNAARTE
ncbi:MAG: hypothetical protein V7K46_26615 [Nostoc sp.]